MWTLPYRSVSGRRTIAQTRARRPPWWFFFVSFLGVCAWMCAPARADDGAVELVSGGRVTGAIVAVLPNDRVIVRLPDGSSLTFPWAEVRFVFDGLRVYDASGRVGEMPAIAAPAPSPVPDRAGTREATDARRSHLRRADGSAYRTLGELLRDRNVRPGEYAHVRLDGGYALYEGLPGRGRILFDGVLGGLLAAEGFILSVFGMLALDSCAGCGNDFAKTAFGWGVPSLFLGSVLIGRSVHFGKIRRAGTDYLRMQGYQVWSRRPAFDVHAEFAADRWMTRWTFTF